MDQHDEVILAGIIAFIAGTLIASVLWVAPLARQSVRVMDLEAQLATCDSGREVLHHQLHIMNDSVLLLEHRPR